MTVVMLDAALFSVDAKRLPTSATSSASDNLMIMQFFSIKIINIFKIAEMQAPDDVCVPFLKLSDLKSLPDTTDRHTYVCPYSLMTYR